MSTIELFTLLQAIGSLLSAFIGIVGFVFVYRQILQLRAAVSRDALESLYARNHDIHHIFVEYPQLRPYFYDKVAIKNVDEYFGLVRTVSEMLVDFYEGVSLQQEHMPKELFESWRRYCQDLCNRSPALQEYLRDHMHWYSEELLRDLLITTTAPALPPRA